MQVSKRRTPDCVSINMARWIAIRVTAGFHVRLFLRFHNDGHHLTKGKVYLPPLLFATSRVSLINKYNFVNRSRYNIIFMVMTYLIPVIIMGACYSRMSHVLWRSQGIGELSQRQTESIQSKRKVSR